MRIATWNDTARRWFAAAALAVMAAGGCGAGIDTKADAGARGGFLEVERFARLPGDEQVKGFAAFYKRVAPPHILEPAGMRIMNSIPGDILDRSNKRFPEGGVEESWGRQLQEAAATLTPEEVADKLGSNLWLEEAAHIRTKQALKRHPEAFHALVKADLDATDEAAFARGCAVAGQLDLKEFSGKLVAVYLADNALSPAAGRALQYLRDPEIVGPLVADIEKNPQHVKRYEVLLQGAQWHRRANPALVKLLDSPDADIRYFAAGSMYECKDAALAKPLAKLVKDSDPRLVAAALYMAGNLDDHAFAAVGDAFAALLQSKDQALKVDAIACLAKHKDLRAGPALLAMLREPRMDPGAAVTLIQSLQALTGGSFGYDAIEWGPKKNAAAIAKVEEWLKEHSGV